MQLLLKDWGKALGRRMVGGQVVACGAVLAAVSVAACSGGEPAAPAPPLEQSAAVRGAHESVANPEETFVDDHGLNIDGIAIDFPARLYPGSEDFPTGPEVGERLPEFTLSNQHGEPVDFHADRGGHQAVVVFYRSAVW